MSLRLIAYDTDEKNQLFASHFFAECFVTQGVYFTNNSDRAQSLSPRISRITSIDAGITLPLNRATAYFKTGVYEISIQSPQARV